MKKYKRILISLVFLSGFILFFSCDDVFEQDISNINVTLLGPMNGLETESVIHTFLWEIVKGADSYNFQIVSPNFHSIESVVMDTILVDSKILITLKPGKFQWRVNAVNSYFKSSYTTYDLTIAKSPESNNLYEALLKLNYQSDNKACYLRR
jgi:hypothetical protein